MKNIFLLTLGLVLVSCGSDGDSASDDKYVGSISDTTIVSLTQDSSSIAKTIPEKAVELVIPSAYAASGEIRCFSGADVNLEIVLSFDVDTNVPIYVAPNTISVDTTCSNDINKDIRVSMLNALGNKTLLLKGNSVNDKTNSGKYLHFGNSVVGTKITYATASSGRTAEGCYERMSFNTDGTLDISHDFHTTYMAKLNNGINIRNNVGCTGAGTSTDGSGNDVYGDACTGAEGTGGLKQSDFSGGTIVDENGNPAVVNPALVNAVDGDGNYMNYQNYAFQECLDGEFIGATYSDFNVQAAFRFKDGMLETDWVAPYDFTDDSDFNKFCVVSNFADTTCDIGTF